MIGAVEFALSVPVQFGSESVDRITLQPPKGKHIRDMPLEPGIGYMMTIASRISGRPPSFFDEMAAEDVTELSAVVSGFLTRSRPIGPTS